MRSPCHPDGSIDYDAHRPLEILRFADEELARHHQARQEDALRMAAGGHDETDMVMKKLGASAAGAKVTFPGMPSGSFAVLCSPF